MKLTRWKTTGRPPCRTLKELADECDVSPAQLSSTVGHDSAAPRQLFTAGTGTNSKNAWYDPKAVRAWWAARKAK